MYNLYNYKSHENTGYSVHYFTLNACCDGGGVPKSKVPINFLHQSQAAVKTFLPSLIPKSKLILGDKSQFPAIYLS